jgi:hypothetical protein
MVNNNSIKELKDILENIYNWNQNDLEYYNYLSPNPQMLKDRREVIMEALEIVNEINNK